VLAATTHTYLLEGLHPSVHIHKRFGKEIQVNYYPNEPLKECSLLKQIRIEEGRTADYKVLAGFHYRSHHVGAVRKIFRATRNDEICGVIVYTYPGIGVLGRQKVLPKMPVSELNQKLNNIMRVVDHPKYRTIELGQNLYGKPQKISYSQYLHLKLGTGGNSMKEKILLKGIPASSGKAVGTVRIVKEADDVKKFSENEILVAPFTSPLLTVAILKASAIITDKGGIMSHAAIVAREAGIPCITGTDRATEILKDGEEVIVNGEEGVVYARG